MEKIALSVPLVEMNGDEMTRVLWQQIKDELLLPYIELKTEYYDLGLANRENTKDQVTLGAARAIKKYGVGVKCATITPNAQRMEEYGLSQMWKSPNATIRAELDGTVFRAPIIAKGISPLIKTWKKPITIARHAFGDIYKAVEYKVEGPGKAELVFTSSDGQVTRRTIEEFSASGVLSGQFNLDESICSFAHTCFRYAIDTRQDLWFGAKDTISKTYDHTFKDIFAELYETEYKKSFEELGIKYFYTLIDSVVAWAVRSQGGFVWACKNYDGDVMSDLLSAAFGSMGMMTSVLVSPDGNYEYEAAHGTVTDHYYAYLRGEKTSTNPMATIFAWTGALRRRGALDGLEKLERFADRLERAALDVIEGGMVTSDLLDAWDGEKPARMVDSETFLQSIRARLEQGV